MPLVSWESDFITSKVVDVRAVATREKTTMFYPRVILLFTLHTLLNAIICCSQLNNERGSNDNRKVDY